MNGGTCAHVHQCMHAYMCVPVLERLVGKITTESIYDGITGILIFLFVFINSVNSILSFRIFVM